MKRSQDKNNNLTVRTYRVDKSTYNKEARTVDAVLATEDRVMVFDMARWEMVEEVLLMDGVELPDQIPLCDTHDRSSIQKMAGSSRNLRIEEGTPRKLVGTNHFARNKVGTEGAELVEDGHLKDNSIGYAIKQGGWVAIPAGKSQRINGRNFSAAKDRALRVVTGWILKENSLTTIGADQKAKNRSDNNLEIPTMKKTKKQKKFEAWLETRGMAFDDLTETQRDAFEVDFDAQQAAEAAEARAARTRSQADDISNEKRIRDAAIEEERARVKAIKDLAGTDIPDEVVERCVSEEKTIEESQAIFLAAVRNSRATIGSPMISVASEDFAREDLEAAMLLRVAEYEPMVLKEYGEERTNRAGDLQDACLVDIAVRSLMIDRVAIPHGRDNVIRAAFSAHTLPILLGNVANKAMLKGYRDQPATWRSWCSVGSLPDFKTNQRIRLTDMGELDEVNKAGEVKHGSASEEYEEYSLATYAKQFAITRQDIINDDLAAFTKMPQKLGIKANQRINKLVYTHLLANGNMQDSIALFHASHSNLNTSNALAVAALGTALTKYRQQTDAAGEPIDIEPAILLVPPELEMTALELTESDHVIMTGSTDAKRGRKNVLKGRAKAEVETRLSNSNYTGYSATSWYLSGSPAACDTVEVGFLNGKSTPTVERFATLPDVMGIILRVFIDAGVKATDFRALQKNTA